MKASVWIGLGLVGFLVLGSGGCTAKLQQELQDRNATVEELNGLVSDLRREAQLEQERARALEEKNQQLQASNADLAGKLAKKPEEDERLRRELPPEAVLGWRHNMISIGLPSTVTFASGKHELTGQGEGVVRKVAEVIQRRFPDRWLYVAGHTDTEPIQKTKGIYRSNRHLSLERADTVAAFLIASGVAVRQVAVLGYGQNDPKASNKDEQGRQQNRRVEVLIGPPLGK